MDRIGKWAVVVGLVIMLGLDQLGAYAIVFLGAGDMFADVRSEAEVMQAWSAAFTRPGVAVSMLIYGSLTSVLGGYVAARMAGKFPYFNALAVGVLGTLLSVGSWIYFPDVYPAWYVLLGLVMSLIATVFGGHLVARRSPRKT